MTALPASTDFTGAAITEAQFKTAISDLRSYLAGLFGTDGTAATAISTLGASPFPAGTLMLFVQTAAPTGWTKSTTHTDKVLRVVSGTASSGGSVAFSTVFSRTATDAHTLTVAQMPSHDHPGTFGFSSGSYEGYTSEYYSVMATWGSTHAGVGAPAQGGGGSHTHNIDLRVNYVDVIIASKDA